MGFNRPSDTIARDKREAEARAVKHLQATDARRRNIGEKVATVLIDQINASIIRPGPMNEERECYDMADELRAMRPEIASLVAAIIEVDETGQWDLAGQDEPEVPQ